PHHVCSLCLSLLLLFLFNHPTPPEFYPLSLHDALPICKQGSQFLAPEQEALIREVIERDYLKPPRPPFSRVVEQIRLNGGRVGRSEEHTSELQSLTNLVCRLLLEKKKNI